MKLHQALIFILFLFLIRQGFASDFNPAVLWPSSGEITNDPFAIQVYEGVTLFEVFQNAPVQKYRGPGKQRSALDILSGAASLDSNPIFTFGHSYTSALLEISAQYPHIQFVAIDAGMQGELPDNLSVVEFANEEGAYLMGILAAFTTESDKVGFVGGMDVGSIRDYGCGYIQGAQSVKPGLSFTVDMISETALGFNDQATAEKLAMEQYTSGTDIIFHAAGASGFGVFEAAEKTERLAIGVDSNQNPIKPGRIVSSLLKRIDIITYNLLKSVASKEAVPQQNQAGIREGAFDWVVDDHNLDFIDLNIKNAIDRAQVAIASGAITVKKSQDSAECNRIWQEQL